MNIGWPQAIYLALTFMSLGIVAARNGEPREPYSLGLQCVTTALAFGLLWWGGFFS